MGVARVLREALPLLYQGILVTVQITAASLLIAVVVGLLVCLLGMSKIKLFSIISKFYIWLIRGTPLLVQTFFVYFGAPQLIQSFGIDFRLTAYSAGLIALSLNAGAYIAEIFRGGIQAVDSGQMEAARSLGLTKASSMRHVILPQAVRISVPSLVNQMIITLKDTSIISVISLADIVYQAKIYIGRTMESFATWTVVGVFYLVVVTVLTFLSNYAEKKMSYGKNS
ncbi:MAG: amino acid ABC transporter permease [Clostridiales bacterium]|nr:amino acid ABC transporter permease [Clostridiales bacterium]